MRLLRENGLIRQYVPKGADFADVTEDDLAFIMRRLNNRPRKCLGMKTPNQVFFGQRKLLHLGVESEESHQLHTRYNQSICHESIQYIHRMHPVTLPGASSQDCESIE